MQVLSAGLLCERDLRKFLTTPSNEAGEGIRQKLPILIQQSPGCTDATVQSEF
jgi:hypothetical protein